MWGANTLRSLPPVVGPLGVRIQERSTSERCYSVSVFRKNVNNRTKASRLARTL